MRFLFVYIINKILIFGILEDIPNVRKVLISYEISKSVHETILSKF